MAKAAAAPTDVMRKHIRGIPLLERKEYDVLRNIIGTDTEAYELFDDHIPHIIAETDPNVKWYRGVMLQVPPDNIAFKTRGLKLNYVYFTEHDVKSMEREGGFHISMKKDDNLPFIRETMDSIGSLGHRVIN